MLRRSVLAGMLLLVGGGLTLRADTLEDVEKKLQEAHGKLKSFSASTKVTQDINLGEAAGSSKSETSGTIEWMRKDGKDLMRADLKTVGEQTFGGQSMKIDQKMLTVSDGDVVYVLTEMVMPSMEGAAASPEPQKQCMKTKAEPNMGYDPKSTFDALRQSHALKLMPDDKVDGYDCYVIEAMPKEEVAGYPTVRQMYYLAKDTGINIQMIGYDKDNKAVVTSRVADVKINADIKSERFKFEPPPGVQVMDMAAMQGTQGQEQP